MQKGLLLSILQHCFASVFPYLKQPISSPPFSLPKLSLPPPLQVIIQNYHPFLTKQERGSNYFCLNILSKVGIENDSILKKDQQATTFKHSPYTSFIILEVCLESNDWQNLKALLQICKKCHTEVCKYKKDSDNLAFKVSSQVS